MDVHKASVVIGIRDASRKYVMASIVPTRPVYHGDHGTRTLKELAQNYESLVSDRMRVKNRLKAIYRGRGLKRA